MRLEQLQLRRMAPSDAPYHGEVGQSQILLDRKATTLWGMMFGSHCRRDRQLIALSHPRSIHWEDAVNGWHLIRFMNH